MFKALWWWNEFLLRPIIHSLIHHSTNILRLSLMKWLIVQVKTVEHGRFHTIRQAQHLCQALHKAWGTHCEPWIKQKMPLVSQSLHPNAGGGKLPSKQIKEKTDFWSMTVLCRKRDYVECDHQNVGPGDGRVRETLSEKTTWWHSSWDLNDDKSSAMRISIKSQDSPGERIPDCKPQSGPG